jgi:hypothetical protein
MNEPCSRYDRAAVGADNPGDLGGERGLRAVKMAIDRQHRGKQPQRETDAKETVSVTTRSSSKGRSLPDDARLTRVLEYPTPRALIVANETERE